MKRNYRITLFKRLPGDPTPYGAKSFVGNLDRACKRLVKKFGAYATVRVLAPGKYSAAQGAAELEIIR